MAYATGKWAFGFCDRCQFRYDLHELRYQVVATRPTKLRVCSSCMDVDHPQLMLGRVKIFDPIALLDPRPPLEIDVTDADALETDTGLPIQTDGGATIIV